MNDVSPPAPRPPVIRPRWQRPRDRRVVAGVAQGAADALGIGVGWIRAALVVMLFFGGLAVVLYVAGWVLMPSDDEPESIAERWTRGLGGDAARWLGVALIAVAAVVLLSSTGFVDGGWIWAVALLVIGVLLYRGDIEATPRHRAPTGHDGSSGVVDSTHDHVVEPSAAGDESADPVTDDPYSDRAVARYAETSDAADTSYVADTGISTWQPPAPPPSRPPRERSMLGRFTFAAVLFTIGGTALLDNLDVVRPDARHYVAGVFAVLGVALVVGAWWGRVRGAIVAGILLAPALVLTTLVDIPFEGDIGDARYNPASVAELQNPYELAIGELRIDLRDFDDDAEIKADLGIGLLWVIVPADAAVTINGDVGIGELDLLDLRRGGLGVDRVVSSGGSGPDLVLDLDVGIGSIRVDRPDS